MILDPLHGNKYLKDGDVSFAVVGDGNLVSTSATATGVKVAVDAAKGERFSC